MTTKRKKARNNAKIDVDNRNWKDLKDYEVECLICKNLLKEPITLPCRQVI